LPISGSVPKVYLGVLLWAGLVLREPRLRSLLADSLRIL